MRDAGFSGSSADPVFESQLEGVDFQLRTEDALADVETCMQGCFWTQKGSLETRFWQLAPSHLSLFPKTVGLQPGTPIGIPVWSPTLVP